MTLYEVGLFFNSKYVFSEKFNNLGKNNSQSLKIRSHIINIISEMNKKVNNESIFYLNKGKYTVFFLNAQDGNDEKYFVYTIGDERSDLEIVRTLLFNLLDRIRKISKNKNFFNIYGLNNNKLRKLSNLVNEILSDEKLKPNDRIAQYIFQ